MLVFLIMVVLGWILRLLFNLNVFIFNKSVMSMYFVRGLVVWCEYYVLGRFGG